MRTRGTDPDGEKAMPLKKLRETCIRCSAPVEAPGSDFCNAVNRTGKPCTKVFKGDGACPRCGRGNCSCVLPQDPEVTRAQFKANGPSTRSRVDMMIAIADRSFTKGPHRDLVENIAKRMHRANVVARRDHSADDNGIEVFQSIFLDRLVVHVATRIKAMEKRDETRNLNDTVTVDKTKEPN